MNKRNEVPTILKLLCPWEKNILHSTIFKKNEVNKALAILELQSPVGESQPRFFFFNLPHGKLPSLTLHPDGDLSCRSPPRSSPPFVLSAARVSSSWKEMPSPPISTSLTSPRGSLVLHSSTLVSPNSRRSHASVTVQPERKLHGSFIQSDSRPSCKLSPLLASEGSPCPGQEPPSHC